MILGYIRVSTKEQNIDLQLDAIKKAGAEKFYIDKLSATKERPELENLLEFVRSGDTIIVWKLDRIARSLKHLIEIVELLKKKEVNFISLTETIDTTTSLGQFFLQIIGAFAELDRNLIVERTNAGLKAAKEKGRLGGRKKGLSKEAQNKAKAVANIYKNHENNLKIDEICELFNISRATLYRYLRAENVDFKRNVNKK